jgi:AraC family transcriptional regulator
LSCETEIWFSCQNKRLLIDPTIKPESKAICALFRDSALVRPSSVELGWNDIAIERRISPPREKAEIMLDHYYVLLWDIHAVEGESAHRSGKYVRYRKQPNTITTLLPGPFPAVRNFSQHSAIICALKPDFLHRLEDELDNRPRGLLKSLYGHNDAILRNLTRLLINEAEAGGPNGRLYADSLSTALATRLLFAARSVRQPAGSKISPLPHNSLRRVLERMHADLHANLNLQALAAETGYSRSHFLRMFRQATGRTPHRYLLELRLEKAKALISGKAMPLVDIAAVCGFSSHGHLTTAFRLRFGSTPSQYLRNL